MKRRLTNAFERLGQYNFCHLVTEHEGFVADFGDSFGNYNLTAIVGRAICKNVAFDGEIGIRSVYISENLFHHFFGRIEKSLFCSFQR